MSKSVSRLTEKRMNNRKFRKNEEKILRAFCVEDESMRVDVITRRAGVARSTFYRHHKTVGTIMPDYEDYILRKYKRMMRRLVKNNASTKVMYARTIFFILSQKSAFELLIKSGRRTIFIDMVAVMKPIIKKRGRLSGNGEKIMNVYVGEVAELMYIWVKKGMRKDDLDGLVQDIIYLTDTIKIRLGRLEK